MIKLLDKGHIIGNLYTCILCMARVELFYYMIFQWKKLYCFPFCNANNIMISDLPLEILWIILEHHISKTIQACFYCELYGTHPNWNTLTWGYMVEYYRNIRFDSEGTVLSVHYGREFKFPMTALCVVSLLRSVCKDFKKCIDQNCYVKQKCTDQSLHFIKRDYTIKS